MNLLIGWLLILLAISTKNPWLTIFGILAMALIPSDNRRRG